MSSTPEQAEQPAVSNRLKLAVVAAWVAVGVIVGALLSGCQQPSSGMDSTDKPATAGVQVAPAPSNELADQAEQWVQSMIRAVGAVTGVTPGSASRAMIVQYGKLRDDSGASEKRLAQFAGQLEEALSAAGKRHSVFFSDASSRSPVAAYTLHMAVMGMDEPKAPNWLLRMVLVGPDRDGRLQALWEESAIVPAP